MLEQDTNSEPLYLRINLPMTANDYYITFHKFGNKENVLQQLENELRRIVREETAILLQRQQIEREEFSRAD